MEEITTKRCCTCKQNLPIENFCKRKTTEDGLNYTCRSCQTTQIRKSRNKDNNKRFNEYQKDYKVRNRDKIKEYYQKNKEHFKIYSEQNKTKFREVAIKYKPIRNKKLAERRKHDTGFKFLCIMRSRINTALRNNTKRSITTSLLCADVEFIWKHLEKQFRDGMTRENHGKVWHIDHIIPCSFFDLNDPTEQKLAFHYGNLQPLYCHENQTKADIIPKNTNFKY